MVAAVDNPSVNNLPVVVAFDFSEARGAETTTAAGAAAPASPSPAAMTPIPTDTTPPEAVSTPPATNESSFWRKASFTEPEAFVLNSLFVDNKYNNNKSSTTSHENPSPFVPPAGVGVDDDDDPNKKKNAESSPAAMLASATTTRQERQLSADMLSSVMPSFAPPPPPPPQRDPPKRASILGLWSAHAAGIHPRALIQHHHANQPEQHDDVEQTDNSKQRDGADSSKKEDVDDEYPSDIEVLGGLEDETETLSWDSQDDMNNHSYDAWEVLKDEYSSDYGFSFTPAMTNQGSTLSSEEPLSGFVILGTSADDVSAQPHVLSPPLLDSLMNFLPENVIGQNFWLRYSLIRDGASLETLKHYVRAADHTLLAIETPAGQVFGVYCSSPWRNHQGYFGSPLSAFVWKMRYSRRTKCASLFEQAHLESEIDVYMATPNDPEQPIQVCRHDILGVGGYEDADNEGDAITMDYNDGDDPSAFLKTRTGFAICIDEYLGEVSLLPRKSHYQSCHRVYDASSETNEQKPVIYPKCRNLINAP
jgi:TLD